MANWKFTDDYGTQFPALYGSVLDMLVFSSHTITGNNFTGTLDFQATGPALDVAGQLFGVTGINFTGTLSVSSGFTLSLQSTGTLTAQSIPIIGQYIDSVTVTLNTVITLPTDDLPATDNFLLNVVMKYTGQANVITGTFVTQIPMAYGSFTMNSTFQNVGVSLSDLDFLLPSGTSFSTYFPSDNPLIQSLYTAGTTPLDLLELDLTLHVSNAGGLKFSVLSLAITVGIVNIPVYNSALFINPLAVSVNFYNLPSLSLSHWSIYGTLALYPVASQTNPPTVPPDFSFTVGMSLPIASTPFFISGSFDNPNNLPISTMMQDLFGTTTTIGAADSIIITEFDFSASASNSGGAISSFSMDVGLASPFGLFQTQTFDIDEFTISFAYTQT